MARRDARTGTLSACSAFLGGRKEKVLAWETTTERLRASQAVPQPQPTKAWAIAKKRFPVHNPSE